MLILLSDALEITKLTEDKFLKLSLSDQKKYLEAFPKSSFAKHLRHFPDVKNISLALGTSPKELGTYLKEPATARLLKATGEGFVTLFDTIDKVMKLPNQGLKKGFEKLHKTKAFQKLQEGTIKVDKFLEKNPVLKKAGGPLVAGALAYQWLNMSFSGDFDDDFNLDSLTDALKGEYSIEELLGTPEGIKGVFQLTLGLATGGLLSFPWHRKMNIAFAAAYTGARKLKQTEKAQDMLNKWRAFRNERRKIP